MRLLAGKLNQFKQMLTTKTKETYRQYKDADNLFLFLSVSLLAGKITKYKREFYSWKRWPCLNENKNKLTAR